MKTVKIFAILALSLIFSANAFAAPRQDYNVYRQNYSKQQYKKQEKFKNYDYQKKQKHKQKHANYKKGKHAKGKYVPAAHAKCGHKHNRQFVHKVNISCGSCNRYECNRDAKAALAVGLGIVTTAVIINAAL